jgi:hypothetical protein
MLSERDYMNRTPEEKAQENAQNAKDLARVKRRNKLFALYSKQHKTIFDKIRIRIIEGQNRRSGSSNPVTIAVCIVVIVICGLVIRYEITGEALLTPLLTNRQTFSFPTLAEAGGQEKDPPASDSGSEIPLPDNGHIFLGEDLVNKAANDPNHYAPLSVTAGNTGENYYIKLKDVSTNADVMAFFLENGQSVQVMVPLGNYYFCYATGNIWQGEEKLFGDGTVYYQADNVMPFTVNGNQLEGRSVILQKTPVGNMTERNISANDF